MMRMKYKSPEQFFYRLFWRVLSYTLHDSGALTATNKAGKVLMLPPHMCIIIIGK